MLGWFNVVDCLSSMWLGFGAGCFFERVALCVLIVLGLWDG